MLRGGILLWLVWEGSDFYFQNPNQNGPCPNHDHQRRGRLSIYYYGVGYGAVKGVIDHR